MPVLDPLNESGSGLPELPPPASAYQPVPEHLILRADGPTTTEILDELRAERF
ncbi:MAG: hypothetical protein FWD29_07090 [Micrococcales bacterium]|nr:hypothetical protein [Micrococcales bacterium]